MLFSDFDFKDKRVVVRVDLNVPVVDGKVVSSARVDAVLPTVRFLVGQGARVCLLSHFGRPKEGVFDEAFSLAPVARYLSGVLGQDVSLVSEYVGQEVVVEPGQVVLFENVRFFVGEKANDDGLARQLAALCDVFVMDAFGVAHRKHASCFGVAQFAPQVCFGLLMAREIEVLSEALSSPKSPAVAIVGGSKVSSKLAVLESLAGIFDHLIVGGGIANTFLAARGFNVGKSLFEPELVETAKRIMDQVDVPLPVDVVCASEFSASAVGQVKLLDDVGDDDLILDVGPVSVARYAELVSSAGSVFWNGPLGVFEFDQFVAGTRGLCEAISRSCAFSVAGGGDTIAAIEKFGVEDTISFISTGGGAFLEFIESKSLPCIEVIRQRQSVSVFSED